MNRQTAIYRLKSPSIKERNQRAAFDQRMSEFLYKRNQALEFALKLAVKEHGSQLETGKHSLTITDTGANGPHDVLEFVEGDGTITVIVKDQRLEDPDLAAQVTAFKEEVNGDSDPAEAEAS